MIIDQSKSVYNHKKYGPYPAMKNEPIFYSWQLWANGLSW